MSHLPMRSLQSCRCHPDPALSSCWAPRKASRGGRRPVRPSWRPPPPPPAPRGEPSPALSSSWTILSAAAKLPEHGVRILIFDEIWIGFTLLSSYPLYLWRIEDIFYPVRRTRCKLHFVHRGHHGERDYLSLWHKFLLKVDLRASFCTWGEDKILHSLLIST